MKLKRFSQFVKESLVTESSAVAEIEENIFLIDDAIYIIDLIAIEIDFDYEPADPEVGIMHGGYVSDETSLDGLDGVRKVTDPAIISKVKELLNSPAELKSMGFDGIDVYSEIADLVYNADDEELGGEELTAFTDNFKILYNSHKLIDLTGSFEKRESAQVERATEDFEPDEPDYDDYDDRY
jgi:hypothetical protein